jgi:hypothetical protein
MGALLMYDHCMGWLKTDLFFLDHALRHGMSVQKVAGFLGRSEDEVRARARELHEDLIPKGPIASPRLAGLKSPAPRDRALLNSMK